LYPCFLLVVVVIVGDDRGGNGVGDGGSFSI
jgi:hypothetical protein